MADHEHTIIMARARLELDKLDAWTNGRQAEETPDLGPLFGGAA